MFHIVYVQATGESVSVSLSMCVVWSVYLSIVLLKEPFLAGTYLSGDFFCERPRISQEFKIQYLLHVCF